MHALAKVLIMGILTSLLGCGSIKKSKIENVSPKESFAVITAKYKGKTIVGSINQAYKNYDKKAQYPWLLTISVGLDLKHLNENGLPDQQESAIAYKEEDELVAQIKSLTTAHYIGHLFNDTFLDIYIYVGDPEKINQYLKAKVDEKGLLRGFGYRMINDPKWNGVHSFFQ